MSVCLLNMISMYLPKREELSLRVVLALPKASMMGLVARICSSVSLIESILPLRLPGLSGDSRVAKYLIMYLALTVLPAPDSPETTMVWFFWSRNMSLYVSAVDGKVAAPGVVRWQPVHVNDGTYPKASSAMANRWGRHRIAACRHRPAPFQARRASRRVRRGSSRSRRYPSRCRFHSADSAA